MKQYPVTLTINVVTSDFNVVHDYCSNVLDQECMVSANTRRHQQHWPQRESVRERQQFLKLPLVINLLQNPVFTFIL
jgi:hypothetical protein